MRHSSGAIWGECVFSNKNGTVFHLSTLVFNSSEACPLFFAPFTSGAATLFSERKSHLSLLYSPSSGLVTDVDENRKLRLLTFTHLTANISQESRAKKICEIKITSFATVMFLPSSLFYNCIVSFFLQQQQLDNLHINWKASDALLILYLCLNKQKHTF